MIVIPLLMSGYHMASPCIAPMNTGIFVLLSVLQNYTVGDRISELMHIVQVSEDPAIFWENIRTNLGSTHQIRFSTQRSRALNRSQQGLRAHLQDPRSRRNCLSRMMQRRRRRPDRRTKGMTKASPFLQEIRSEAQDPQAHGHKSPA